VAAEGQAGRCGLSVEASRTQTDRLIHGCLGIDDDTVSSIVRDDVASLRVALIALLTAKP
jgi:uncharacterized protein with HEPN domain